MNEPPDDMLEYKKVFLQTEENYVSTGRDMFSKDETEPLAHDFYFLVNWPKNTETELSSKAN